jgi:predicted porin
MKKSLLALAALTAFAGAASAQSTVTLSGNVKAGLASTKYSGGAAGTNGSALGLADGSSRFILSGSEDLGGGLRANFQVDTRFRIDDNGGAPTSSPLAGGATFIGLSGKGGNLQIGKLDTHYCLGSDGHGVRSTALQASSCGILGFVGSVAAPIANTSRSVNVIRYTAPRFGNVTVAGNYITSFAGPEGAVGSPSKGKAVSFSAMYAAGPLTAGVSMWNATGENQTSTAARTGQKASTAMVNFNAGVATIGLTYDVSAQRAAAANAGFVDTKRTAWSVPVTVPMGAGTALLTYTKAGDTKTGATTNANTGATLLSVGYDYALSKRTTVGVSYARMANEAAAAYALYTQAALNGTPNNAAGQDPSQLYFGVRHAF